MYSLLSLHTWSTSLVLEEYGDWNNLDIFGLHTSIEFARKEVAGFGNHKLQVGRLTGRLMHMNSR